EVDERQARGGVEPPLQMSRRFLDDDLERRPHAPLEQVTAMRAAVSTPDHDVAVQLRFLAVERNDAKERENFNLLAQRNPLVLARHAIEIAERHLAQRADRGDLARAQRLAARERGEALHDLLAPLEDHHERAFPAVEQERRFHSGPSPGEDIATPLPSML